MSDLRTELKQAFEQSRQLTLELFQDIDPQTFCQQAHPTFSPIGWHLGHIAFTEALWILEHLAGQSPIFTEYRQLFAADGLPKEKRQELPDFKVIQDYLVVIREKVFEYLAIAPLEKQERLWRWLLQHETQHNETIAFVLALHKLNAAQPVFAAIQADTPQSFQPSMVEIPAGKFRCGSDDIVAQDNERSPHWIDLETYQIDRYPVTCGEFQTFINSGGYQTKKYWTAEGWQWQTQAQVTKPLYWLNAEKYRDYPVCGVNYYEAQAYANFVGKRLPTEYEWEKAAAWQPHTQQTQLYPWGNDWQADCCNHSLKQRGIVSVNYYSKNQSFYGCDDCIGNVWEWTASVFQPYPEFVVYPYKGYSANYFDNEHFVLRGGSWVTRRWGIRNTFRNWYHPWTREIFAGFRCVC
ncbi:hypothetical protein Lepto7376_1155 [[Leptolyngbya] sp. PCC 7376]|uniref:SUMF1/EgtB/PvdO family nonheme iron enzyme n=1 Tax=[Leptolyngbya] sp. PCC 7376 TaxID=111781 RepID=UPI00029F4C4D|nr:SUMF1/EgtB/PvdO family nonheme iron enzyme [[Leptolyngbya] sp. PCC 7376]AFY37518.1 hypothetical protein Lepto7376_1155 [[Leptolyngbya] sp. PCC 7376]